MYVVQDFYWATLDGTHLFRTEGNNRKNLFVLIFFREAEKFVDSGGDRPASGNDENKVEFE